MSVTVSILEREGELRRIAAALQAAARGDGRVVIIEGPAGIGKSRLVAEARALGKADRFGRVQATGDELESVMPWSVVRQFIERAILRHGPGVRERLLAGPAGAALAALEGPASDSAAADIATARTLHALWWVAADLSSERPLLITVDDAQWADVPSLRFLVYLARRIADLPIALIVATRPLPGRSGPLAELVAVPSGERLLPRPLSSSAIGALCGSSEVAPAVLEALHAASGGNPFLAGQLVEELQARELKLDHPATARVVAGLGPATISRALLSRLPLDAVQLAASAAVLGAHSDPQLAAMLARIDPSRLTSAIDALTGGHVLSGGVRELCFVHPVVREAVLAELAPGERAALHAAAAVELHAGSAPVERVAAHLAAAPAGTLADSAALLRSAAAGLVSDGDPETAARYLRRALEEAPENTGVQAELGFALLQAGAAAAAREHLRSAARAAPSGDERAQRLAGAASATALAIGPRAAIAELRAALDDEPDSGADSARLVLEARLATICSFLPDESHRSGERLRRFASVPGCTPQERTLLALLAQRKRYDVNPARDVAAIAGRALGEGAYLRDVAAGADGLVGWIVAVAALIAADATDVAAHEIAHARRWVREHGSPLDFGMVTNAAAILGWRTGDVATTEAETDAAWAAVAAEQLGTHVIAVRATAAHYGVLAALERGDRGAATVALERFDARCGGGPPLIQVHWLREARAMHALACDEPERAWQDAIAFGDEVRAARVDAPSVAWRIPAVLAAQRLDRPADASALAAEQLELARRWGAASDIGAALRLRARVSPEQRLDLLHEAVGVLERSPATLELARALVDLGSALRVARRRSVAYEPLRRGADLAAVCGSRVLRQHALEGLTALGDRPRKQMFSGEESLTASERRVAALAIGGRTNRDIAHELFVTPKTVENHLGRVYVKLGITSRRELAGALD